jgi:hypothetical protein
MKIKLTFLWKEHEDIKDTDGHVQYLQTNIIPKILEIPGVDHVELCHFVPFSLLDPVDETDKQKHIVVQMDVIYEGESGLEQAMANFNDSYLVEEIIRQNDYLDLYVSYSTSFEKEKLFIKKKNFFGF